VCSCCGKPYVANGERSSTLIEIEVRAHTRRIVRPRWRRGCECPSSPLEVTAPAPARLFARTPYGTSVWARVLFERYACLRPLSRVSAWLSDQGLRISVGTVASSVPRFLPLFEPVAAAILAHQNGAGSSKRPASMELKLGSSGLLQRVALRCLSAAVVDGLQEIVDFTPLRIRVMREKNEYQEYQQAKHLHRSSSRENCHASPLHDDDVSSLAAVSMRSPLSASSPVPA